MNVRGVELALHPAGDYVSDVIRETGDFYEAAILDEIAHRVTGGVLLDIGAHIGNHAAYFEAFVPHSRIHAFEPIAENVRLLLRNAPSAFVNRIALGDRNGMARFERDANVGHCRVSEAGDIEARMLPLDWYEFSNVSLLKIDVEGYEPQVLAGARATIARWHPLILIEDWKREYADLLPGYRLAAEWEKAHQTFLYEPTPE